MSDYYYDIAQICLSGNVINDSYERNPEENKKFCEICGEKTITKCPNFKSEIKGAKYVLIDLATNPQFAYDPYMKSNEPFKSSAFCTNCGNPYSWTKKKIKAAREITQELENLSPEEKEILTQSIDDIIRDTQRAEIAAIKFKKLLPKIGKKQLFFLKIFWSIS